MTTGTAEADVMTKAEGGISSLRTTRTFLKEGTCSETLMIVLDRAFGHPLKLEERAAQPFAGGLMQHGYQCGVIWGAALAAGAQAYRVLGPGPQAEAGAVVAAQRLAESFRARNKEINCLELTETDMQSSKQLWKYFLKGGSIRCFRMAAKYAPVAFGEIEAALSERHVEAPAAPASCAALLARRMGASDMHAAMAAGLAGGIGLSGGACGALGAALWTIAMNCLEEGVGDNVWKSKVFQSRAGDTIDRFLRSADFKFECSEVVGRRFESIADHAAYVRDGGCSKIIEALAAR